MNESSLSTYAISRLSDTFGFTPKDTKRKMRIMLKRIIKFLLGLVILLAVIGIVLGVFYQCSQQSMTQSVLISMFGEKDYEQISEFAHKMGIDLSDDAQVQKFLSENGDKADELQELYENVQSGQMTHDEAMKKAEKILKDTTSSSSQSTKGDEK